MNKLEQNVVAFKDFVLDEFNTLKTKCDNLDKINAFNDILIKSLRDEILKQTINEQGMKDLIMNRNFLKKSFNDLQDKHQALTTLSLKLTDENERLSKKVSTIGDLSKIETLEKQLQAMTASHAYLIKQNSDLQTRYNQEIFDFRNHVDQVSKENADLKTSNTKLSTLLDQQDYIIYHIGSFLTDMGYKVVVTTNGDKNPVIKITKPVMDLTPIPDKTLDELIPKMGYLRNLLVEALGDKYHVEVIGGDEKSQKVMKDLFSQAKSVRDSRGRFTKK